MSVRRGSTQGRADQAAALLDNPLLKEARDAVRQAVVARITAGDLDADIDHELCNLLRAGDMYWRTLERYLSTGNVELHAQDQRRKVA